jgi:hypothetical protein
MTRPHTLLHITHKGVTIPNPTDAQLEAAVQTLARNGALVLTETAETRIEHYIQTRLHLNGIHDLEYRAGSPADHYLTHVVSADLVTAAFTAWHHEDPTWLTPFTWKPHPHFAPI